MAFGVPWHGIPDAIDGAWKAIDGFQCETDDIPSAIDGGPNAIDGFRNAIDGIALLHRRDIEPDRWGST